MPRRTCNQCPPALLLVMFGAYAGAADLKRPNILFASADDWGRPASAYARRDGPDTMNDLLHTPNVDRVAAEGGLFREAFVSSPSCPPCRSALLSGQHFWRTGGSAILQGAIRVGSQPSFAVPLASRWGGVPVPATMPGLVEPARDAVFIGRERHVENARNGFLPCPQRALRTHEFLYLINFQPERWPWGEPYRLDGSHPPALKELTEDTSPPVAPA